jgi:hypothetical protein
MKDVKINISSAGFPSQFVSDSEKSTDEFGLADRSSYSIRVVQKRRK